jgi:Sigma-70, region 4
MVLWCEQVQDGWMDAKATMRGTGVTLAALMSDERQALEMTFFAGLTHAEAATELNQPLGTIKTRIRSGCTSFGTCWQQKPGTHDHAVNRAT